jgi:hypothetical protein
VGGEGYSMSRYPRPTNPAVWHRDRWQEPDRSAGESRKADRRIIAQGRDRFQHQPLNRQADRYALEGVPIAMSTMADAVESVCAALDPLLRLVEAHVMAAERLHADDTTVSVLTKGKTDTERCWIYVRDDKPFGGEGPPAAMFYNSRDRKGEHPQGASGGVYRYPAGRRL